MVSRMKKVCVFMLAACAVLFLAGCASVPEKEAAAPEKAPVTSLLKAAELDDIEAFTALVQGGADLNETTAKGLTVQIALAYFSDDNFEKACQVLSAAGFDFDRQNPKGVTLLYTLAYGLQAEKVKTLLSYGVDVNKMVDGLYPIQATQFSTYPFTTTQIIESETYTRVDKIQQLLLANGSAPFSYVQPTYGYVGDFTFCLINSIFSFDNSINISDIMGRIEMKEISTEGRDAFAVRVEALNALFRRFGIKNKVYQCNDKAEIPAWIQTANDDPDYPYFIYAFTGDSKIAPYHWVIVQDIYSDGRCDVFVPNSVFEHAEFTFNDFSDLILIRIEM